MGCPTVVDPPLVVGVVVGMVKRGGLEVLTMVAGKREGQTWATTFVVARFRDVPSTSLLPYFLPLLLRLSAFPSVKRDRNGPTSLRGGEGHPCVGGPGWERAGAMSDEEGGSGRGKMKPTSTVDGVDDGFKLRSLAQ